MITVLGFSMIMYASAYTCTNLKTAYKHAGCCQNENGYVTTNASGVCPVALASITFRYNTVVTAENAHNVSGRITNGFGLAMKGALGSQLESELPELPDGCTGFMDKFKNTIPTFLASMIGQDIHELVLSFQGSTLQNANFDQVLELFERRKLQEGSKRELTMSQAKKLVKNKFNIVTDKCLPPSPLPPPFLFPLLLLQPPTPLASSSITNHD